MALGETSPHSLKRRGSLGLAMGLYKDEQPEFGCYHITDPNGSAYPHVKPTMYNNLVATDSSHLGRVATDSVNHAYAVLEAAVHSPDGLIATIVLIISLMRLQARVVGACFDAEYLVLRPTKAYDFSHGSPRLSKYLPSGI
ncbi:hypothetical protein IFM46972_09086 [Aspergillus udagawae]|uniref:Uncharacterized protein n=1 Tax=Aspergillus udagawae TaxID=91492 RepID=A0A8H3PIM3_9EURO|nr:hypothetical protein IFM46972_09086 [Aspergillus udagawae]